jgi:hypothetical protein
VPDATGLFYGACMEVTGQTPPAGLARPGRLARNQAPRSEHGTRSTRPLKIFMPNGPWCVFRTRFVNLAAEFPGLRQPLRLKFQGPLLLDLSARSA